MVRQGEDIKTSDKSEEQQSRKKEKFPCIYEKFLHCCILPYTIRREANLKAIHEDLVGVRTRDDDCANMLLLEGPECRNNEI